MACDGFLILVRPIVREDTISCKIVVYVFMIGPTLHRIMKAENSLIFNDTSFPMMKAYLS